MKNLSLNNTPVWIRCSEKCSFCVHMYSWALYIRVFGVCKERSWIKMVFLGRKLPLLMTPCQKDTLLRGSVCHCMNLFSDLKFCIKKYFWLLKKRPCFLSHSCTVYLVLTYPLDSKSTKSPCQKPYSLKAGFSQHPEQDKECCHCYWQQEVTLTSLTYWKLLILTEWERNMWKLLFCFL